jgi:hypothetical protein
MRLPQCHGELGAARFHPLVIALQVIGEEHRCGLTLLEQGLLIRFGRGIAIERQLQFGAVGVFR